VSIEKLSNPAVVGLGGFGGTTLLLQFHNLGWCGAGPVFWCAVFFGGLAQLVAGLQESKTGNNFGFAVFTTYGAFWMALAGILASAKYGWMDIDTTDIGWFLVIFTVLTLMYFVGAMKQNYMLPFTFLTLLAGFICLDISHLGGPAILTKVAAIVLIVCALSSWYMTLHIVFQDLGWNLPMGKPWIK
jgi:succinate-acetate transporter protein